MTSPIRAPLGLTQQAAEASQSPSDLRQGTVQAVTSRGLDISVAGGLIEGAAHLSSYNPGVGDPVSMISFGDAWLALGRPVGPGTSSDNATPGTGAGVTLLGGNVLSGGGTTIATSTGAVVVVPRYGVSLFHPANHWIMLMTGITWYSSVANDWVKFQVANAVTGAVVGETEVIQAGNNFFGSFVTITSMVPPTQGGQGASYYLTLQRENGAGTSRVDDAVNRRGYMVALDMGDGSIVGTV